MMKSLPANGDVLRWARINYGWDLREAAAALKIEPDELADIEENRVQVPARLIDRMAVVYETTESVLFLPNPPPVRPIPDDYRTPQGLAPNLRPPTRVAIREAWEFAEEATDLLFEEEAAARTYAATPLATIDDDPETIAAAERARLGVTLDEQRRHKDRAAFELWRNALDDRGVIVLKKHMPWEDCRGFLLWAPDVIPTVVVNSQDRPGASVFTLFHEYAHLVLREPASCAQKDVDPSRSGVEDWCNQFAANLLMPRSEVEPIVEAKLRRKEMDEWALGDYRSVQSYFHVSTMAAARRIKELYGSDFYDDNFQLLRGFDLHKQSDPREGDEVRRIPYMIRLAELGKVMAGRVIHAIRDNTISPREASNLLGLNAGQLHAFQTKAKL